MRDVKMDGFVPDGDAGRDRSACMTPEAFSESLEHCGIPHGARVLAAVSGGADSLCQLWLLCAVRDSYPLQVECAHAEHGLRGADSLEDMAFVQAVCRKWNIPCHTKHLEVPLHGELGGTEEAARTLRYAFLRETAAKTECCCILTAHHRRDQAETVLMRAARGTDLKGLCAMRAREGDLARPLLDCEPEELRALLALHGIAWREDETNRDTAYARNRVRLRILPELEKVAPGAERALCRLAAAAARDEDFFDTELRKAGLSSPVMLADGAALPTAALMRAHPAIASRALARLLAFAGCTASAQLIGEILSAMREECPKEALNLPGKGRLYPGKRLTCAVFPHRPIPSFRIVPGLNETAFGRFLLRRADQGEIGDGRSAQAIPETLVGSLTVGARAAGETMIPFGKRSPCELRKLISDAGIEPAVRRSVPVVRAEGEALWLAGIRPSERCRTYGVGNWMLEYEGPVMPSSDRGPADHK